MATDADAVGLAFTSVGDAVMLNGKTIRVNNASPRMISVYDAMEGVGLSAPYARKAWVDMKLADAEVATPNCDIAASARNVLAAV